MRMIRIFACLTAAFAVSALAAESAWAAVEYDSPIHPAQTLSTSTNIQGFNGGGVVIACPLLTANNGEELGRPGLIENKNPTTNVAALVTHPIYGGPGASEECRGTIGAASFKVEVRTRGCNFVTHAAKPNNGLKTAEVDIKCGTGVAGIENVFIGLEGCIITVFPQTLKGLEYKNEPKTGSATESEVTTASEVKGIKSKATSICGIAAGTAEFEAEYREGKIEEVAGVKTAKISEAGNPAKSVAKAVKPIEPTVLGEVTEKSQIVKVPAPGTTAGILAGARVGGAKIAAGAVVKTVINEHEVELEDKNPGGLCPIAPATTCPVEGTEAVAKTVKEKLTFSTAEPIAGAVGVNENHWYSQNVGLPKQSGAQCKVLACPGEEGEDIMAWGTLVLKSIVIGELICQNELGGDIYNPQGSEFASINNATGEAEIGKVKVDAFQAYDCTNTECEATDKSKMTLTSEGLGVTVNAVTKEAEFGEWEGTLTGVNAEGKPELSIGNELAVSPTQIKFQLLCPPNGAGELKPKAKGQLHPVFESGTSKGSSPAILTFKEGVGGSGELEIGTTHDGKVTGKLKAMGFLGGEFIAAKAP